jgi:hypothetical protein
MKRLRKIDAAAKNGEGDSSTLGEATAAKKSSSLKQNKTKLKFEAQIVDKKTPVARKAERRR